MCVSLEDSLYIKVELHERVCESHFGGKVVRDGYYWQCALRDANEFFRRCMKCQPFAGVPHLPLEELKPITSPCLFAHCGVDLVGPESLGKEGVKFVIVVMDYFTKGWELKLWP